MPKTKKVVKKETKKEIKKVIKKAKKVIQVEPDVTIVIDPNLKWYVVNTYSGHEKKVSKLIQQRVEASQIQNKVTEVLVPTRNIVTIKDGKQKIKEDQIYPGYVFIKMVLNQETWHIVRNTEGITGFIGSSGRPKPVSDSEVEGIKKLISTNQPQFQASFNIGDAVKIKTGAFADFMGTVNSINEQKGQVTVLISIFGRETPVDLDFTDVTKL